MKLSTYRKEYRRHAQRVRRKREERDKARDAEVTEAYGEAGHGSCGRKKRYRDLETALAYAERQEKRFGKHLRAYRCAKCGGWHLSSKKGEGHMRPSEVLERAREAVIRVNEIADDLRSLDERIGVQGHSYGYHSKSGIRDPMDKVDDKLDGTMELERERGECMNDISEGWAVVDGFRALDNDNKAFVTDGEYLLTSYYMRAKDMDEVVRGSGRSKDLCSLLMESVLSYCDEAGMAGLKRAAGR